LENRFGRFRKEQKFGLAKLKGFLASKLSYLAKGTCQNCMGFFFSKFGHRFGELGEEIEVQFSEIRS